MRRFLATAAILTIAATSLFGQAKSSDHLHPSDAGYKAMGESIDLALFKLSGS